MAVKAYGSITVIDVSDLGTLSVTPESNQPTTFVYDEDSRSYSPALSSSNALTLSPVIYYAGKSVSNTDSKVKITWKRKEGSSAATAITSGVTNGVLTLAASPVSSSIPVVTYIVHVDYTDADTGAALSAEGQITYSLVTSPSSLKSANITGESVFKYDSSQKIVSGNESITLTGKVEGYNVSISKWQYKTASGGWTTITSAGSSNTCTINHTDAYFNNNVATIRLVTTDSNTYDDHTIIKIYDGAPGDQVVSGVLSNDDQMIACDSSGNATSASLATAVTTISIYEGNTDVTSEWTIKPSATGCTYSVSGYTYSVTAISADVADITFTCSKTGYSDIVKKFSLTKVKTGKDGVNPIVYSLEIDSLVINKSIGGSFSPTSITMKAYKTQGTTKTAYSGYFTVTLDSATTAAYTSTAAEASHTYTVPSTISKFLTVRLYSASGVSNSNLLDSQTVVIAADGATGAKGATGDAGKDSYSFVLGNYSDVIPCTTGRVATAAYTITIPFSAYKGTSQIACTATYSTLPSGVTLKSNTAGTASSNGSLVFSVASGANFGGTSTTYDTGTITITLAADGKSNVQHYTWTKNVQAASGTSAVLLRITTPSGNIIKNNENDVTLTAVVTSGTTVVTPTAIQWYKYNPSSTAGYDTITDATSATYTVKSDSVDSMASYKCQITYGGKTYVDYVSVYDYTDPIQVYIHSTLGDKITNSIGKGVIYASVFRDGEEITTPVEESITCATSDPSSASSGDLYFKMNSSTGLAQLRKYSGSAWADVTDSGLTYTWTLRDKDNNVKNTLTGRAIYVDANVVTKKMIFDVEVTATGS